MSSTSATTSEATQVNRDARADPFAGQRTGDNNPFAEDHSHDSDQLTVREETGSPIQEGVTPPKRDRRESKEWGTSINIFSGLFSNHPIYLGKF